MAIACLICAIGAFLVVPGRAGAASPAASAFDTAVETGAPGAPINLSRPATAWEARIDELCAPASAEVDPDRRVAYYHEAQAIAAENVPLIHTTLGERSVAVRNVFGNTTPTFFGLGDIRYLYRTDR